MSRPFLRNMGCVGADFVRPHPFAPRRVIDTFANKSCFLERPFFLQILTVSKITLPSGAIQLVPSDRERSSLEQWKESRFCPLGEFEYLFSLLSKGEWGTSDSSAKGLQEDAFLWTRRRTFISNFCKYPRWGLFHPFLNIRVFAVHLSKLGC